MPRVAKQILIGLIYIGLFFSIGYGVYYLNHKPTCFDGIQNQNEEGLDCGLVCGNSCRKVLPVQVSSVRLFKIGEGDYDVLAQVYNPNSDLGSPKVDYDLIFLDSDNTEISRSSFDFYILPGQTKHIILTSIKSQPDIAMASIAIKDVTWEKLNMVNMQSISFPVKDKQFKDTELGAVVFNDSDFDFDTVDIGVILYDQNDNVIGVNRSNVNTLLSRTDRFFKVLWPKPIVGVFRVDVEPNTNLLSNSNFIKRYGTDEKFQEYY